MMTQGSKFNDANNNEKNNEEVKTQTTAAESAADANFGNLLVAGVGTGASRRLGVAEKAERKQVEALQERARKAWDRKSFWGKDDAADVKKSAEDALGEATKICANLAKVKDVGDVVVEACKTFLPESDLVETVAGVKKRTEFARTIKAKAIQYIVEGEFDEELELHANLDRVAALLAWMRKIGFPQNNKDPQLIADDVVHGVVEYVYDVKNKRFLDSFAEDKKFFAEIDANDKKDLAAVKTEFVVWLVSFACLWSCLAKFEQDAKAVFVKWYLLSWRHAKDAGRDQTLLEVVRSVFGGIGFRRGGVLAGNPFFGSAWARAGLNPNRPKVWGEILVSVYCQALEGGVRRQLKPGENWEDFERWSGCFMKRLVDVPNEYALKKYAGLAGVIHFMNRALLETVEGMRDELYNNKAGGNQYNVSQTYNIPDTACDDANSGDGEESPKGGANGTGSRREVEGKNYVKTGGEAYERVVIEDDARFDKDVWKERFPLVINEALQQFAPVKLLIWRRVTLAEDRKKVAEMQTLARELGLKKTTVESRYYSVFREIRETVQKALGDDYLAQLNAWAEENPKVVASLLKRIDPKTGKYDPF